METAHVIGTGGIGVVLGWSLARAGWDVTMVDANPQKIAAGNQQGLSVDGKTENCVKFRNFVDWTVPAQGSVLLCTKTYDNAEVLARLHSRRLLVPVQNGFDLALESSDHPCEGIASFVSQCERNRPATRITRQGPLYFGGRRQLAKEEQDDLKNLVAGLNQGGKVQAHVVERIGSYKHSKLMYNAAISPLAAAAGVDNGHLLSDALARKLFFALLQENYRILHRCGVPLARIGPFPPWAVNLILSVPGLGPALAHMFRPGLAGTYCSMAPDIGTGKTEIAAYNGHLKKLAQGSTCPINTAVLELISRMQNQNLPPSRERLRELQNALGNGGPA